MEGSGKVICGGEGGGIEMDMKGLCCLYFFSLSHYRIRLHLYISHQHKWAGVGRLYVEVKVER